MLVHRRVTPAIKFAGTHLYTWVERRTGKVSCPRTQRNATQCPCVMYPVLQDIHFKGRPLSVFFRRGRLRKRYIAPVYLSRCFAHYLDFGRTKKNTVATTSKEKLKRKSSQKNVQLITIESLDNGHPRGRVYGPLSTDGY